MFEKDLIYLFYGRPAYRKRLATAMRTAGRAPVVLLFTEAVERLAIRLFPFDSGAFAGNRYETWMHRHMTIDEFELPCDSVCPPNFVKAFYENNDNYWDCEPTGLPRNTAGEHEVESLFDMIRDLDIASADDRRLSLELIVGTAVPLTPEYVRAIIVPSPMMDASYVKDIFTEQGIPLAPYRFRKNQPAIEYQVALENQIYAILEALSAFKS
ncbi:hypothetical protein AS149_25285 [Burkholderia cenocepacia]|nr:hypothetical protein AS149_25285 [Burkholderia cenocepacia]